MIRRIPFVAVVLWIFTLPAVAAAQSDAEQALQAGKAAYAAEKFVDAKELLEKASQTAPANPDVHLWLGKSYYQLGDLEKALASWQRVLKIAPQHAYAKRMVKVLQNRSSSVETQIKVIRSLLAEDLISEAHRALQELRHHSPLDDGQAKVVLLLEAEAYLGKGSPTTALRALQELQVRDKDMADSAGARLLRGRALLHVGGIRATQGQLILKSIVADFADSPEQAAAELELLVHQVQQGKNVVAAIAKWLADHPGHTSAPRAVGQLIQSVGTFITVAATTPAPEKGAPLSPLDEAVLAAAEQAFPVLVQSSDAQTLAEQVVNHLHHRYVEQKSFATAEQALARLAKLSLPIATDVWLGSQITNVQRMRASDELTIIIAAMQTRPVKVDEFTAWIKANANHPDVNTARIQIMRIHLNVALDSGDATEDSPLHAGETAALSMASSIIADSKRSAELQSVVETLVAHFKNRYQAKKAWKTYSAALSKLNESPLPRVLQLSLSTELKNNASLAAKDELDKIIFALDQGTSLDLAPLAAWIKAHPEHSASAAARTKLLDRYLLASKRSQIPNPDITLTEFDTKAFALAKELFDDLSTTKDLLALADKLINHINTQYFGAGALQAAIAGHTAILELPLKTARGKVIQSLCNVRQQQLIGQLNKDVQAGIPIADVEPPQLAAIVKDYDELEKLTPGTSADLRVNLAKHLLAVSSTIPWEQEPKSLKPPTRWAAELTLAVVKRRPPHHGGIEILNGIVNEYTKKAQPTTRILAADLQSRLAAALENTSAWTDVATKLVSLRLAVAQDVFDANRKRREHDKNDLYTAEHKAIIALAGKITNAKPATADSMVKLLSQGFGRWLSFGHDSVVEQVYAQLVAGLPNATQREVQLSIAQIWLNQFTTSHQKLLASGFQPAEELDPLAKKVLESCYRLHAGLKETDPFLDRVRAVRARVIAHYEYLEYFNAVEAAISVKTEPAVPMADIYAELELAGLRHRLAEIDLQEKIDQFQGRQRVALTPQFQQAIGAFKKFIVDHPSHSLANSAKSQLFRIAERFRNLEAFDIASGVYADIEKFASGVDTLKHADPGTPTTAERAAFELAETIHQKARTALAKSREGLPSDAAPPAALIPEHQAAIAAYQRIIATYPDSPLINTTIGKLMSIGLEYANIDSWRVADEVYATIQKQELSLRRPDRLEFARAICIVGEVLPQHAREVLSAISLWDSTTSPGDSPISQLADARKYQYFGLGDDPFGAFGSVPGADAPQGEAEPKPDAAAVAGAPQPARPSIKLPAGGSNPAPNASDVAGFAFGGGGGGFKAANEFADQFRSNKQLAAREAQLLAAVKKQQSSIANRIASLRDDAIVLNSPAQQKPESSESDTQEESQQARTPATPVLSDAELARQQDALDRAYVAFAAIRQKHSDSSSADLARDEIMGLVNHWRGIRKWDRAAQLVKRFLGDNPLDSHLPKLRHEVARDYLAWAAEGVKPGASKQKMLEEIAKRYTLARTELKEIVAAFPDEISLKHQAQWDVAQSFLSQARVVAGVSSTLARGQFVRAANELLATSELYHDHPQIAQIPNMLWGISNELVQRGFFDEAITVWNDMTLHFPGHAQANQAALRIAQTYQQNLRQPLRAVEAYLELNFARGGADQGIQNTVLQIATQLKNEKRWVEALHVFETFIDTFPTHAQAGAALTMVGEIHQTNEVWEDAIAAYDRVIAEYPAAQWTKQAKWSIAECTINLSQWDKAIDAYREYQKAYTDDKAKVAEATRRLEILKDLARFQKVVDEKGQRKAFDAQFQIATIIRDKLTNPVKAVIEYRKVASNWSNSHLADDALFQVGLIYSNRGETEAARKAFLRVAENYPNSPLADDALFQVGTSYESEASHLAGVTRGKSIARANDIAQRQAYQLSQSNRRMQRGRVTEQLSKLKSQGKDEEADNKFAFLAAQNTAFDYANAEVLSVWAEQQAVVLTTAQLADRQDKINGALRKAVASYRRAASVASADKADDALLRMAQIYDQQLKDSEAAMATWLEIVKQYSGTAVAENASWKIAQYYEHHQSHKQAITAYQSFLRNYRRSPKASAAQAAIAENHEQLGEWVDAMDAYTNYINNYPNGSLVEKAKEQISWIKTYRL